VAIDVYAVIYLIFSVIYVKKDFYKIYT